MNSVRRNCFASKIPSCGITNASFALREFWLPHEQRILDRADSAAAVLLRTPRQCLLCLRDEVCREVMRVRCDRGAVVPRVGFARISNQVGPGEYPADAVLVSRPNVYEGIVDPVVVPRIRDYRVVRMSGGNVFVEQLIPRPGPNQEPPFFF